MLKFRMQIYFNASFVICAFQKGYYIYLLYIQIYCCGSITLHDLFFFYLVSNIHSEKCYA
jgi:hypothetical protein